MVPSLMWEYIFNQGGKSQGQGLAAKQLLKETSANEAKPKKSTKRKG